MTERRPRSWPSIGGGSVERATEAFRRLEDMTRLISDWVWETDADGVITYVSGRIIDRMGMHPVHVTGKRLTDVGRFVDLGGGTGSPDFKRPFRDLTFDALGHDGAVRHFMMSSLPRFDAADGGFIGATGIARDVTDIVRAERANIRLADAIEVLSEFFALYDENDKLVISNAKFRELNKDFGDAARPGARFDDLLAKEVAAGRYVEAMDNPAEWIAERKRLRASGTGTFEIPIDGGRWLAIDEERLPDGGTVMMARDITEIKSAMHALRSNAERHRGFAADVAHKLRTPLAVLRSNLDMAGDGDQSDQLIREVDGLARIVEQLLTFTRYENYTLPGDAEADLHAVAVHVIGAIAPQVIRDGRSIDLEGIKGPIMVHGDAGALEHALRNLIENAMKYSSRGANVMVTIENDPPLIRVYDQGRGISMEERALLFQPFHRLDRRGVGAGLGLNIVKVIADAHGAEIAVNENPSGGSIFSLQFPLYRVRQTAQAGE